MAILSIQEIMEAQDITERTVEIPEWGGEVVVRSISHNQMRKIKREIAARKGADAEPDEDEIEKQILLKGLVQPTISDEEADFLFEKSTTAVNKVLTAILGTSNAQEKSAKQEEKTFPAGTE